MAIAGLFVSFLAGAALLTWIQTPLYRGRTVVEIHGQNREFLNMPDFQPSTSSRSQDSFVATQTKLILTETLAKRVVERVSLAQNPTILEQGPGKRWLQELLKIPGPPSRRSNGRGRSIANADQRQSRRRFRSHLDHGNYSRREPFGRARQ